MPRALALLAPLVALGCSGDRAQDGFLAVILGSVLVILAVGFCGFTFYMGMLVGGGINIKINTSRPTPKSRRWGFIFGVINVLHGAVGVWLFVLMAQSPRGEDPPGADVYLMLGVGTLAAFAVGVGAMVAAARPKPPPDPDDDVI